MEPEVSLPCSQQPATGHNPQPDTASAGTHPPFLRYIFNMILDAFLDLQSGLFPSNFASENL
jgi:hypothetical protein